ncbi:MAG: methyltransferase domain-containing protein, partial [Specibacter sp.]
AVLDGMSLVITAIDPDPRAHAYASALPATAGVAYRRAHSRELVAEGEGFDVVISNHILHHLDAAELRGLLQDTEALCPRLAVHSDIARSKAAYALFSAGTRPFFPGSFIRRDGLTSIRRSYTATELAAAVPPPWRVEAARPFRLALTLSAEPGHA